jgi:hypothetical protein
LRKWKNYSQVIAIDIFSRTVSRSDPQAGFAWALQIDNEAQRRQRFMYAGRNWLKNEHKIARAWIAKNTSVISDIREELFKPKAKK